jgi:NAD(P)-dependent dehydrogenase (short-subunit alcohol dehydrogenase family)
MQLTRIATAHSRKQHERLDGKSALVTGGSGGFGKTCAALLAKDGAAVTLMARNTQSLCHALRRSLTPARRANLVTRTGESRGHLTAGETHALPAQLIPGDKRQQHCREDQASRG